MSMCACLREFECQPNKGHVYDCKDLSNLSPPHCLHLRICTHLHLCICMYLAISVICIMHNHITKTQFCIYLFLCCNVSFFQIDLCSLTTLPSALGELTSIKQLYVAKNKLTSLPNEIGLLRQLEVLKANSNR